MAGSYSDEDKLLAIGVVERNGGQITKEAIKEIRLLLDAPSLNKSTIYRWYVARDELHVVATDLQPIKKDEVGTAIQAEPRWLHSEAAQEVQKILTLHYAETVRNYLNRANDEAVVKEVKGKDAVTAAAIATDKMLLLMKLPVEVMEVMPDLIEAIEDAGYPVVPFLQRVMVRLRDGE